MIWEHKAETKFDLLPDELALFKANQAAAQSRVYDQKMTCRYCEAPLQLLGEKTPKWGYSYVRVRVCPTCGWWVVLLSGGCNAGYEGDIMIGRTAGVLCHLDLCDLAIPLEELKRYLLARYSDRFSLNPRKFEEVVGGVFADFGFRVRVTSYSGDGGLDVIILESGSETVGVQVKRLAGMVEAEQIRALAGALVLRGITQGVFVTTSGFRSGAISTASRYLERGLGITLWDASTFYDKLRLAQRPFYTELEDPTTPFYPLLQDVQRIPIVASHSW